MERVVMRHGSATGGHRLQDRLQDPGQMSAQPSFIIQTTRSDTADLINIEPRLGVSGMEGGGRLQGLG